MSEKITVIGSANADLVICSEKMPRLGETLTGSNFQINAGGKGLNQAVAIAKLGGEVAFLGAVGNDGNGAALLKTLEDNGVDFYGIKSDDVSTGIAMITVVNGDNFIILNPGANELLTPERTEEYEQLISESAYCVLQLEIPVETVERVCATAKAGGVKTVLNPAPCRELSEQLLKNTDYLIPNEYETYGLTGINPDSEENCIKAVRALLERGVGTVIITLGERGCVYNSGEDIVFCPAADAEVVDTTSAGDCFIGAVVSMLSRGESLDRAVSFGTKAAAIAVSREGASKSIPYINEIE